MKILQSDSLVGGTFGTVLQIFLLVLLTVLSPWVASFGVVGLQFLVAALRNIREAPS
jgi:hypothetical protein